MTAPRFDPSAEDAVLDETRTVVASRDDLPNVLFNEALSRGYYGDDPRYAILPSEQQLDEFDAALAESLYRDRFANAADFGFAFVGDFDTSEMIDLASRYIGTLPGAGPARGYVDNQPLPPRTVQVITIEAGLGEQGELGMFFTNEFEPVLENRLAARLTELIVNARLRDHIREELGNTYAVSASIDLQRDPDPFAEAAVTSTGDPEVLDVISDEIVADLEDLQTNGPTDLQFLTGVEQLRDEFELLDNRTLAEALVTAHLYPDQPVAEIGDRYSLIDDLTPEDVRRMAAIAFNLDQRIEVRRVPLQ